GAPAPARVARLALDLRAALARANAPVDVIVLTRAPITPAFLASARAAAGPFALRSAWRLIDGFAATLTPRQVAILARRPDVAQIEPDRPVHAFASTAKTSYGVSKAVGDFGVNGDRDGSLHSY